MPSKIERFFTWVWRLNGLLVLALATIGLIGAGFLIADAARTSGPRQMVLVSADGKMKQLLSQPIDELIGQHHVDTSSLLIFYVRNGAFHVLDLDPVSLAVSSDSVLVVDS